MGILYLLLVLSRIYINIRYLLCSYSPDKLHRILSWISGCVFHIAKMVLSILMLLDLCILYYY
eukprot:UN18980